MRIAAPDDCKSNKIVCVLAPNGSPACLGIEIRLPASQGLLGYASVSKAA